MMEHYFYWDPPRFIFTIPIIDRPVAWYGFFFILGFIVGFFLVRKMFQRKLKEIRPNANIKDIATYLTDKLTWHILIGTVIGARLGHVFFYDWPRYQNQPLDILKVWEGGLASHGGAIGIMIALFIYIKAIRKEYPEFHLLTVLDFVTVPTAFACASIRIGNFFNQEILGPVTNVPWAIIFGHPYDGTAPMPRHPVQLYESFSYFIIFIILVTLWAKKYEKLREGTLTGLFLVLVFGVRFFLEFFKNPDSLVFEETYLLTSQWLSLPFIAFGIYLLFPKRDARHFNGSS